MLWVKGSGGDLGTMKLDGFSTLYMEKFLALEKFYKNKGQRQHAGAALCALRFQSESARRHRSTRRFMAWFHRAHVDHMHPDALIAIAASADSKKLTEEIFGGEIGWLPWIRPGYELGLKLA